MKTLEESALKVCASLKEQVVQLQADLAYSNLRVTALKVEWNKAYDIGVSVKHELAKYRDAPVVAWMFEENQEALLPHEVELAHKSRWPERYKPLIVKPGENK